MGTQGTHISDSWIPHYFSNPQTIHTINIESPALKARIGQIGINWALFGHFWAPLSTLLVIKKNQNVIVVSIMSYISPFLPKKTKNKVILNYHTLPLSTLTTVHWVDTFGWKKQLFLNLSFPVQDTEKWIKHHLFVYKRSITDQNFKGLGKKLRLLHPWQVQTWNVYSHKDFCCSWIPSLGLFFPIFVQHPWNFGQL